MLTDDIKSLGGTARDLIGALGQTSAENKKAQAENTKAKAEVTTANTLAKYAPLAIGAVVLLVAALFFFRRRR